MKSVKPLSISEFEKSAKNNHSLKINNFEDFFSKQINDATIFATGPYFWFIGNNSEMKIVAASKNVSELTPFSNERWTKSNAYFLVENLHHDDSFYVLSALSLAVKKITKWI